MRDEPTVISQLVRMAQFGLAATTIELLASQSAPTDADSIVIQELLSSFEDRLPLVRAIDGERLLFAEPLFRLPRSEMQITLEGFCAVDGKKLLGIFRPLRQFDHATYLRIMTVYARHASGAYSLQNSQEMDTMLDELPSYCILTKLFVPGISSVKTRHTAMATRARIIRAALAVLSYHRSRGDYPADLSEVIQPPPIDPFSGKPLLFRRERTGFSLYSVGLNQFDDGGVAGESWQEGDIVWPHTPAPAGQ